MNPLNHNSDAELFVDPLEDYTPKAYADKLEEVICETPAAVLQHTPYTVISPKAKVADAVEQLAVNNVACLLVADDGIPVGVFTHREVLNTIALEPEALTRPVREHMTSDPVCVAEDDPVAATLCVMAVHGYRHVPIVDGDGKVFGIISPQRVTKFLTDQMTDAA